MRRGISLIAWCGRELRVPGADGAEGLTPARTVPRPCTGFQKAGGERAVVEAFGEAAVHGGLVGELLTAFREVDRETSVTVPLACQRAAYVHGAGQQPVTR